MESTKAEIDLSKEDIDLSLSGTCLHEERITWGIFGVSSCRKHSAGDALSWEADALPTELLPRGGLRIAHGRGNQR